MKFEILSNCRIEDNVVYLPPEQLERDIYLAVNEVLENLGGKWDRKQGGHIFSYDPTGVIEAVIATKTVPPKNPLAFHPTPMELIEWGLGDMNWLNADHIRILEPSGGTGRIADEVKLRYPAAHLDVVEIEPLNAATLRRNHKNVYEADFLEYKTSEPYDFIFMNPPFSVEGNATCYIDHILHAHSMLKPNRSMTVIVPAGFLFVKHKKVKNFREWCFDRLDWLERIEAGAFETTGVATIMMSLHQSPYTNQEWNGFNSYRTWTATLILDNDRKLLESRGKTQADADYYWDDVVKTGAKQGSYFYLSPDDRKELATRYKEYNK